MNHTPDLRRVLGSAGNPCNCSRPTALSGCLGLSVTGFQPVARPWRDAGINVPATALPEQIAFLIAAQPKIAKCQRCRLAGALPANLGNSWVDETAHDELPVV